MYAGMHRSMSSVVYRVGRSILSACYVPKLPHLRLLCTRVLRRLLYRCVYVFTWPCIGTGSYIGSDSSAYNEVYLRIARKFP